MSSSASLSCLGRPFAFLGDLVGESPCGMAEAELGSMEAHGVEGVENVGQGVVSGEGGRAARGSLDGDIGNAVKGRLGIYWRHAETMRYHFAGIWLQIPRSALIIVLYARPPQSFYSSSGTSNADPAGSHVPPKATSRASFGVIFPSPIPKNPYLMARTPKKPPVSITTNDKSDTKGARSPSPALSSPVGASDERPVGPLSVVVQPEERDPVKVNNASLTELKNACDDSLKRVSHFLPS